MIGATSKSSIDRDPRRIEAMFSGIAHRYDVTNRLMTVGLDGRWRALAAHEAALLAGDEALDVCCGTGDVALTLARRYPGCRVIGVDFSETMLERAREKVASAGLAAWVTFRRGDLLALPFPDGRFAATTVAWGVRNVVDLDQALREMVRVTSPGGRVVCLDSTSPPDGLARMFHSVWFDRLVPALGRVVAGDGSAYAYLPASVKAFPRAERLADIMTAAGLERVRFRRLGLGAVALHVGIVPWRAM